MVLVSEGNTTQRVKSTRIVGELEIIVLGIVVILFCWWLFGGFGYWQLPGLVILFIGLSELINKSLAPEVGKASTSIRVGLLITFIGLASYLSFAMYVVFGILQMISVAIIVIGLILLIKGIISGRK